MWLVGCFLTFVLVMPSWAATSFYTDIDSALEQQRTLKKTPTAQNVAQQISTASSILKNAQPWFCATNKPENLHREVASWLSKLSPEGKNSFVAYHAASAQGAWDTLLKVSDPPALSDVRAFAFHYRFTPLGKSALLRAIAGEWDHGRWESAWLFTQVLLQDWPLELLEGENLFLPWMLVRWGGTLPELKSAAEALEKFAQKKHAVWVSATGMAADVFEKALLSRAPKARPLDLLGDALSGGPTDQRQAAREALRFGLIADPLMTLIASRWPLLPRKLRQADSEKTPDPFSESISCYSGDYFSLEASDEPDKKLLLVVGRLLLAKSASYRRRAFKELVELIDTLPASYEPSDRDTLPRDLIKFASAEDPAMARSVFGSSYALSSVHTGRALKELVLLTGYERTKLALFEALVRERNRMGVEDRLNAAESAAIAILSLPGTQWIPALTQELKTGTPLQRQAAIRILSRVPRKETADVLIENFSTLRTDSERSEVLRYLLINPENETRVFQITRPLLLVQITEELQPVLRNSVQLGRAPLPSDLTEAEVRSLFALLDGGSSTSLKDLRDRLRDSRLPGLEAIFSEVVLHQIDRLHQLNFGNRNENSWEIDNRVDGLLRFGAVSDSLVSSILDRARDLPVGASALSIQEWKKIVWKTAFSIAQNGSAIEPLVLEQISTGTQLDVVSALKALQNYRTAELGLTGQVAEAIYQRVEKLTPQEHDLALALLTTLPYVPAGPSKNVFLNRLAREEISALKPFASDLVSAREELLALSGETHLPAVLEKLSSQPPSTREHTLSAVIPRMLRSAKGAQRAAPVVFEHIRSLDKSLPATSRLRALGPFVQMGPQVYSEIQDMLFQNPPHEFEQEALALALSLEPRQVDPDRLVQNYSSRRFPHLTIPIANYLKPHPEKLEALVVAQLSSPLRNDRFYGWTLVAGLNSVSEAIGEKLISAVEEDQDGHLCRQHEFTSALAKIPLSQHHRARNAILQHRDVVAPFCKSTFYEPLIQFSPVDRKLLEILVVDGIQNTSGWYGEGLVYLGKLGTQHPKTVVEYLKSLPASTLLEIKTRAREERSSKNTQDGRYLDWLLVFDDH